MEHSGNMDHLIWTIYMVILIYFLVGGIGFYVINRKKPPSIARKSYVKFITYFLIINILFFSIVFWPRFFHFLTLVIIGVGFYEVIRLFVTSGRQYVGFFILSSLLFILLSGGFYLYSTMNSKLILFGFLIISIFDSFSQISGQLWGHKKILPKISPNKTVGGILGGAIIALLSGFLLGGLYEASFIDRLVLIGGAIVFAFLGDTLASMYKRKYNVKDYSQLIPGHGGVLDRFDSLIAGGAWVAIYFCLL